MGPQQQGPVFPQPIGMPGWFQPPGQADLVQRLALMMALMVLGMPPVHSCYAPTRYGVSSSVDTSEPRICPPIESETRIGIPVPKLEMDGKQWTRLPAIHCVARQSSLTFTCGLGGRTQRVKYEKFRQPCGVQPTACWKASRVLAGRPAGRTDASAPLSAGAASPPPLLAWGGESLLHPEFTS